MDIVKDLQKDNEKRRQKLDLKRGEVKRLESEKASKEDEHASIVQALIEEREQSREMHQQDITALATRIRDTQDEMQDLKETNERLERELKKERSRNLKLVKKV